MAITFVSSSETLTGGGAMGVPVPAGRHDQDVLVCCIAQDSDAGITPPAGWTQEAAIDNTRITVWSHKIVGVPPGTDGSIPANFNWTVGAATIAVMGAYRDARAPAVDADATAAGGSTTTKIGTPSLTTPDLGGGELGVYVAFGVLYATGGESITTADSPLTLRRSAGSASSGYKFITLADELDVSEDGTNTGTRALTLTADAGTDSRSGCAVFLRQAPVPSVSSIAPTHGIRGEELVVNGADFDTGILAFDFSDGVGGYVAASNVTYESSALLDEVIVPASAATGPTRVRTHSGNGDGPVFTVGALAGGWSFGVVIPG